jgi:hypothetical protein
MLTLEIHDRTLVEKLTDLLQKHFDGDPDRMMAKLLRLYSDRLERLEYSGRVQWPVDGLEYQRRTRDEW